jgi:hypothetical protein
MGLGSDVQSIGDPTPSNAAQGSVDPMSPCGKNSMLKAGLLKPVALSKATARKRTELTAEMEGQIKSM